MRSVADLGYNDQWKVQMNKSTRAHNIHCDGLKSLWCTPHTARYETSLASKRENYGIFPSLSLLYVGGILEDAGCEVQLLTHTEDLTLEETVAHLQKFGPDYIGYT